MRRLALVPIYSVLMFSSACGVAHAGGGSGIVAPPQGLVGGPTVGGYIPCPKGGTGSVQWLGASPPGWQAQSPSNNLILVTKKGSRWAPTAGASQLVCQYSVQQGGEPVIALMRPMPAGTVCSVHPDNSGFDCNRPIQ